MSRAGFSNTTRTSSVIANIFAALVIVAGGCIVTAFASLL
jgi:hypothetical protein